MTEPQVPLSARWSLVALGSVEGHRIRRARDPVAEWLLRRHPELAAEPPPAEVLTAIRARSSLVDRMILDEAARARNEGVDLCYWALGPGLDARWYRLLPLVSDVVVEHREVEAPEVLRAKARLLTDSPYDVPWAQVMRRGLPVDRWSTAPRARTRPLVVAEALGPRLGAEGLSALLHRVRFDTPDAAILLEPPGDVPWTAAEVRSVGWRVVEDVHLPRRQPLVTPEGTVVCPGIQPVRVQKLVAR